MGKESFRRVVREGRHERLAVHNLNSLETLVSRVQYILCAKFTKLFLFLRPFGRVSRWSRVWHVTVWKACLKVWNEPLAHIIAFFTKSTAQISYLMLDWCCLFLRLFSPVLFSCSIDYLIWIAAQSCQPPNRHLLVAPLVFDSSQVLQNHSYKLVSLNPLLLHLWA